MMKGKCHCGKIRFEVRGKPTWLGRCHCVDCQKISGTAFMAFAAFNKEDVKFTQDTAKEYKSSKAITRTFCEGCGSPIEWRKDAEPNDTILTLGLFDDSNQFEVTEDIFEEQKVSWADIGKGKKEKE